MSDVVLSYLGEGSIAIISIEKIRALEVIPYVDVWPSVEIEIPPSGGISPMPCRGNTRLTGNVHEAFFTIIS